MPWEAHCGSFKKVYLLLIISCIVCVVVMSNTSILFANRRSFWMSQVVNQKLSQNRTHSDFAQKFLRNEDNGTDPFGPVNFDINGSDVIVFLHMQKTGGTTFGKHLILNMNLTKECDILGWKRKRRNCLRPNSDVETWLFSRYSTGWACGLHSDWTELHECVSDKMGTIEKIYKERRFFYITILRNPVKRFLSEWLHVRRGATWSASIHSCDGNRNNIPKCYSGDDWSGVTLDEFMACPFNLGVNRQTRMIADLRTVNCYEKWMKSDISDSRTEELDKKLLESAKKNLKEMIFFGLVEKQIELQKLFEYTFPFKFKKDFEQVNVTHIGAIYPSEEQIRKIENLNYLDMDLYNYATKLFDKRFKKSFSLV